MDKKTLKDFIFNFLPYILEKGILIIVIYQYFSGPNIDLSNDLVSDAIQLATLSSKITAHYGEIIVLLVFVIYLVIIRTRVKVVPETTKSKN